MLVNRSNPITHSLELRSLPAEILVQPALLVAVTHESTHVVLDERREVLRREVMENLNEKQEGLGEKREGGVRR